MPLTTPEKCELLRKVSLFDSVEDEGLAAIAERTQEENFETGRYIAREGEMGTGFYFIVDGAARISRHGEEIATRGPGDYFGELSLLNHSPRVASVIASEPTCCLALASWELDEVLEHHPRVAVALLREAARRLSDLERNHPSGSH